MKTLMLVLIVKALVSFGDAKAETVWTPIVETSGSTTIFLVDKSSIVIDGDFTSANIKASPLGDYSLQRWLVNCKERSASILRIVQYNQAGDLTKNLAGPMEVSPIPAGSVAEHLINNLCADKRI